MTKGLEALEKLKQNNKDDSHLFDDELLDIIEKELKRLEQLEKEHNKLLWDYQELVHCGRKSEQETIKALEIVNEKMIQREELRKLMYAKKITAQKLANILGISKQAFYNKLNSNTEFTEREICRLIQIFGEKVWKVTNN